MKDIIYQKRKELNMTQKDLADKLNVSDKAVSRWETGLSYPDITLVKDLCKVLNITIEDLFNNTQSNLNAANIDNETPKIPIDDSKIKNKFTLFYTISLTSMILGMILLLFSNIITLIFGLIFVASSIVLLIYNIIIWKQFYSDMDINNKEKYDRYFYTRYKWFSFIWFIVFLIILVFTIKRGLSILLLLLIISIGTIGIGSFIAFLKIANLWFSQKSRKVIFILLIVTIMTLITILSIYIILALVNLKEEQILDLHSIVYIIPFSTCLATCIYMFFCKKEYGIKRK